MNVFHCIIAADFYNPPKPAAWVDIIDDAGTVQLRSIGESFNGNPNVLAAIEWDQVSPYVVVHKGAISDFKVWLAGWPMETEPTK